MNETTTAEHLIEKLEPHLPPINGANWHDVTCSCGWSGKYVSHWKARVMHDKHVAKEQPEGHYFMKYSNVLTVDELAELTQKHR